MAVTARLRRPWAFMRVGAYKAICLLNEAIYENAAMRGVASIRPGLREQAALWRKKASDTRWPTARPR